MLIIWSGAEAPLLKDTFAGVLRSFRPNIPAHKFVSVVGDMLPEACEGDIVLACGTKALTILQNNKIVQKGRTVTSLREKRHIHAGATWFVTFDPGLVHREPDKAEVIAWDVRLAVRFQSTGSLAPEVGNYQWVNSFKPVIDYVERQFAKTGKPVDVATDTETMGFFPWYDDKDIVSISFTAEPHTAHLLYTGPLKAPIALDPTIPLFDQVKWLLTSPKVRLRVANGKFDMIWIAEKWGIECTNFKFDSMLAGSLVDENRSNSLNLHAKLLTPMGGYDDAFNNKFDKSKMEEVPPEDLLLYAGGDTDACQRASDVIKDELTNDEQLTRFYVKIMHPAARAFEKLERRGVVVNTDKMRVLREDLSKVIKDSELVCLDLLPNKMRIKYRERIEEQLSEGKNPMLPSILKEFFFTPHGLNLKPKMVTAKTNEPSMAKTHLDQFAHVPEAKAMVGALRGMDSALKTRSTFVDGFIRHLRPDGRLHPTYFLAHGEFEGHDDGDTGSVTGRLSAKNPPFQIIPKKTIWAKRIRECYEAPEGYVMAQFDFSQGELRVVACVANEKAMLKAYENNMDLHAVTGARLGGVPYEEFVSWKDHVDAALAKLFEDLRQQAKAGNFGLLYGMGVEGFIAYAWASYGLVLSYNDAEKIRNDFFALYTGLTDYHDNMRGQVRLTGEVRSPLGRIRHLPMIKSWDRQIKSKAERQAINSPIQSTLTDMMIWSIALLQDAYPDLQMVGTCHDSLVVYLPEHEVNLWAGRVVDVMSNLPFHEIGWQPQLKFPVDAEAGPNMATLKKLKLAA